MDILKMNKIKVLIIFITIFVFTFTLRTNILAVESPYIEISNISVDQNNQTIKFSISNYVNVTPTTYGIILSQTDEELTLDNANAYIYSFNQQYKENFSISIRIPEYAYYQNIYAVAYVEVNNEVIYSNKVFSSFAKLANLDKVTIKDIAYQNNALTFVIATTIDNDAEYGFIFSKNQLITSLTIENAKNDQIETIIVKLESINENNEYKVTIKNIPDNHLSIVFKACAYVKINETEETYFTKTYEINISQNIYIVDNFTNLINN